jgi:hypothetical protein
MNMIEHGIFSNVCNIYIIMVTPQKGAEKSKPILQQNFKKKKVFHYIPRYTQCIL